MSKTVAASALFAARLPEEDVEVPGVGTVRIRSLSRAEVLEVQSWGAKEVPPAEQERKLLAWSLVAPKLTEEAAGRWQSAALPEETDPVLTAIGRISGLNERETTKEAVQQFRD